MSRWRLRLALLQPMQVFGLVAVAILIVLAVVGPEIAPYPTTTADLTRILQPPSPEHWFGTDQNGMDILSRIIAAPRIDVLVAFVAIGIAVAVGTPLGVIAGYMEGSERRSASILSEGILRLLDVWQAFPVFILAMVLVAVRGTTVENIIIAVAFVNMPTFLRVARAEVVSLRERPFAEAARSIGASDSGVAFRHLLPNALPPLIAQVSVTMGFAILLTAGLSFVGAGVPQPTPELGGMVAVGAQSMITGQWWPSLFPGVALGLIVFSFAVAGEAVTALFQPRSQMVTGQAARVGAAADPLIASPAGLAQLVTAVEDAGLPGLAVEDGVRVPGLESGPGAGDVPATPSGHVVTLGHGLSRPPDPLLEVDGLTVEFGSKDAPTRVLTDISLWVAAGETVGVVGQAGSGKSVLVRSVLRLLPEEGRVVSGEVRYRGEDILKMETEKLRQLRGVEFVPILPSAKMQLSPVTTVADLMLLVHRAHAKADRKAALKSAVEALRLLGIPDPERRLEAYPHELSGGMAQRVCIAMSLLHHPRLLVADEPTAGLDVTVQRQVLDRLASAALERGAAQLIVTRDLGIVAHYCQRLAVMYGGRIVESGQTADILRDPQHPYTRRLLDASAASSVAV